MSGWISGSVQKGVGGLYASFLLIGFPIRKRLLIVTVTIFKEYLMVTVTIFKKYLIVTIDFFRNGV